MSWAILGLQRPQRKLRGGPILIRVGRCCVLNVDVWIRHMDIILKIYWPQKTARDTFLLNLIANIDLFMQMGTLGRNRKG